MNTKDEFDLPKLVENEQIRVKREVMEKFVKLRKSLGITQEELSKRIGIARPNITRMENGNYNPTLDTLIRLAAGLDMKIDIQFTKNI